jgi:hypothetical protein
MTDLIRVTLVSDLAKLTDKQRKFFHSIFGSADDLDKIPEDKLEDAFDLVQRTIEQNEKEVDHG